MIILVARTFRSSKDRAAHGYYEIIAELFSRPPCVSIFPAFFCRRLSVESLESENSKSNRTDSFHVLWLNELDIKALKISTSEAIVIGHASIVILHWELVFCLILYIIPLFCWVEFLSLACLWNCHEYYRWYWQEYVSRKEGFIKTKLGASNY
jgi:hypothetical protein